MSIAPNPDYQQTVMENINRMKLRKITERIGLIVQRSIAEVQAGIWNDRKRTIMQHRRLQFIGSAAALRLFPHRPTPPSFNRFHLTPANA